MRPRPYIGITGFTARKQIDWLFDSLPKNFSRPVMVGVLVSGKTLHGQPNKWPERYPKVELLKTLFPDSGNALNLIHFNTKEPQNLFEDMCLAQDLAGPNCHGFQLNIAWPDRKVLEDYRIKAPFRQKTIVLQCGGKALDAVARNPSMLAERVRVYEGLVDYVLIDPSGGLGQDFDERFALKCFEALEKNGAESIGLGIAGGLCAGNVGKLRQYVPHFEFSIDAEGKLRDAEDHLDLPGCLAYLQEAERIFRG